MKRISIDFNEAETFYLLMHLEMLIVLDVNFFLIYIKSCWLPVGTLILISESTSIISKDLRLWTNLFPPKALGGRGKKGQEFSCLMILKLKDVY